MADFSLKLAPGEKVLGKFPCMVSGRGDVSIAARDRGLALSTTGRLLLFAEGKLRLAVMHKALVGASPPAGDDDSPLARVVRKVFEVGGIEVRVNVKQTRAQQPAGGNETLDVQEKRIPFNTERLEILPADILIVRGIDIYSNEGSVQLTLAASGGVIEVHVRCLDDMDTVSLLGHLQDLKRAR